MRQFYSTDARCAVVRLYSNWLTSLSEAMPPYLPCHALLVYLSGFCAIALGIALLVPRFTRGAARGLIALAIAVFPANIHMALHPELFPQFSPAALWMRLPLQAVIIAWAYWYTRPASAS